MLHAKNTDLLHDFDSASGHLEGCEGVESLESVSEEEGDRVPRENESHETSTVREGRGRDLSQNVVPKVQVNEVRESTESSRVDV